MSDTGFKVSTPGNDVLTTSIGNLAITTQYSNLKCDLRPIPKHYGTIKFNIASAAAGSVTTIYQIAHGYTYVPDFLTAWNYPAGTSSLADQTLNQTFGIGDIDATLNGSLYISMYTDSTNFTVSVNNSGGSAATNIAGTIRFYIFADDFPLTIQV